MPRLLSFSLLVTPAMGKEVRYLFASRKALLSFTTRLMKERFVGSRIPYLWDNGEWTLDMESIKELDKPVNLKPVFEQVATLFSTFADVHPLPQAAKEELFDAVHAAFNLAGIDWNVEYLRLIGAPSGDEDDERHNYWQERRNIEGTLPESPYSGINLIPGAQNP
jgi:hypothetical protein